MKVFLGFVFLLGVTALSLAISRLSNEAVALASGVVLGVVLGVVVTPPSMQMLVERIVKSLC